MSTPTLVAIDGGRVEPGGFIGRDPLPPVRTPDVPVWNPGGEWETSEFQGTPIVTTATPDESTGGGWTDDNGTFHPDPTFSTTVTAPAPAGSFPWLWLLLAALLAYYLMKRNK